MEDSKPTENQSKTKTPEDTSVVDLTPDMEVPATQQAKIIDLKQVQPASTKTADSSQSDAPATPLLKTKSQGPIDMKASAGTIAQEVDAAFDQLGDSQSPLPDEDRTETDHAAEPASSSVPDQPPDNIFEAADPMARDVAATDRANYEKSQNPSGMATEHPDDEVIFISDTDEENIAPAVAIDRDALANTAAEDTPEIETDDIIELTDIRLPDEMQDTMQVQAADETPNHAAAVTPAMDDEEEIIELTDVIEIDAMDDSAPADKPEIETDDIIELTDIVLPDEMPDAMQVQAGDETPNHAVAVTPTMDDEEEIIELTDVIEIDAMDDSAAIDPIDDTRMEMVIEAEAESVIRLDSVLGGMHAHSHPDSEVPLTATGIEPDLSQEEKSPAETNNAEALGAERVAADAGQGFASAVHATDMARIIEQVIQKQYGHAIEKMIATAVEKIVTREMESIKRSLMNDVEPDA